MDLSSLGLESSTMIGFGNLGKAVCVRSLWLHSSGSLGGWDTKERF